MKQCTMNSFAYHLICVFFTIFCVLRISDGFTIRDDQDKLQMIRSLEKLDKVLSEVIKAEELNQEKNNHPDRYLQKSEKRNEDGAIPYKRNEDGFIPYKRNEDGAIPYKRNNDGPIPLKRNEDGPMPYKRNEVYDLQDVLKYLLELEKNNDKVSASNEEH